MQPCRLTRPNVGRRPVAPQARHGETMLPRVSLPMANPTNPAATADAARLCGVDDFTGTLAAGKAADLVVCGVDPLTDLDGLADPSHVHAVVKEGRLAVDRVGVLAPAGLPDLT